MPNIRRRFPEHTQRRKKERLRKFYRLVNREEQCSLESRGWKLHIGMGREECLSPKQRLWSETWQADASWMTREGGGGGGGISRLFVPRIFAGRGGKKNKSVKARVTLHSRARWVQKKRRLGVRRAALFSFNGLEKSSLGTHTFFHPTFSFLRFFSHCILGKKRKAELLDDSGKRNRCPEQIKGGKGVGVR